MVRNKLANNKNKKFYASPNEITTVNNPIVERTLSKVHIEIKSMRDAINKNEIGLQAIGKILNSWDMSILKVQGKLFGTKSLEASRKKLKPLEVSRIGAVKNES